MGRVEGDVLENEGAVNQVDSVSSSVSRPGSSEQEGKGNLEKLEAHCETISCQTEELGLFLKIEDSLKT